MAEKIQLSKWDNTCTVEQLISHLQEMNRLHSLVVYSWESQILPIRLEKINIETILEEKIVVFDAN